MSKEFKGENGSGSKDRYKITSTFSTGMKTEEEVKVMMMTGRKKPRQREGRKDLSAVRAAQ